MGVMWTLILHYSISLPMWEGEDDSLYGGGTPTPKQRLLGWINNKIPEVPITNFNTDWNNGKAIGALVDAVAPGIHNSVIYKYLLITYKFVAGLCPDWPDWKPDNALQNATEALQLAEEWLSIPQLVRPEEMINPKVDDLSMMTYLSQFPNAKLKDGAPLRPRSNPNRVRCYGPGIQPTGVNMGAPTSFTVETFSAGKGDITAFIQDPNGKLEQVPLKYNDDKAKTYTCTYTPKMEGDHKVCSFCNCYII